MPGGANQIGSGYIFNSGDDIGFLGEDSVYLGGVLIPQEPWIQYVYVDLILQGSYSVPEGKKFVVRDLLESGLGPDDVTGIVGPGWFENFITLGLQQRITKGHCTD